MSKRLTKEEILCKINEVHGDKYDYSLFLSDDFEYKRKGNKIPIICKEHGVFWQSLANHLQGKGCIKCTKEYSPTTDEFVEQSKKVHGDKYDYSKVEYVNNRTNVCIICPIHGEFWQKPYKHLIGRGCQKCSGKAKKTNEEFIAQANEIYNGKYLLNKISYVNNKTKVCVVCKTHGDFWVTPHNILSFGYGCPKCNKSKLENEMSKMLSDNGIEFEEQKRFDWLGNYELDFYLPKYNIAIECQGIQHFKPISLFGGEEQFKVQTNWDLDKKRLCDENGVRVIYYTSNKLFDEFSSTYILSNLNTKETILESINELMLVCYE